MVQTTKQIAARTNRQLIDGNLRVALRHLEAAHGLIEPDTHGDSYHSVVNDVEDVLEKVRQAITA